MSVLRGWVRNAFSRTSARLIFCRVSELVPNVHEQTNGPTTRKKLIFLSPVDGDRLFLAGFAGPEQTASLSSGSDNVVRVGVTAGSWRVQMRNLVVAFVVCAWRNGALN